MFQQTVQGDTKLPKWLSLALTSLLPINNETHISKNYIPIACLNMYKLFTSSLYLFLTDHMQSNIIITPEQAGGKRGVCSAREQLLVNKNMKEVKSLRRSLTAVWLDYKKAFDSVPHSWLICALKLVKVPPDIINGISNLTDCWYTFFNLQGKNESLMSELIRFLKGIFQGDSLFVLLFVLALNPLSFMLRKEKGYLLGKWKIVKHTHNLIVDDLKLFVKNRATLIKQLVYVTFFSDDIGMKFREDKCAYCKSKKR